LVNQRPELLPDCLDGIIRHSVGVFLARILSLRLAKHLPSKAHHWAGHGFKNLPVQKKRQFPNFLKLAVPLRCGGGGDRRRLRLGSMALPFSGTREKEPGGAFELFGLPDPPGNTDSSPCRRWSASGTGSSPVRRTCSAFRRARETRKPRLLLRFPGSFLLRFADRQFLAGLFQLPPRFTRFEPPSDKTPRCFQALSDRMRGSPPSARPQEAIQLLLRFRIARRRNGKQLELHFANRLS
jgi:hypothetical protein